MAVKVKNILWLQYEDETDIADAVDHALAHSHYEGGSIIRWTHNGIEMSCCEGDKRKEVMERYHDQRRRKLS